MVNGAAERRTEYWQNRIQPYLKEIWPKSISVASRSIANSFARLCMAAGDAFPDAVFELRDWLVDATQPDVTLHEFRETHLAERFPEAALSFLSAILVKNLPVLPENLRASLNAIATASLGLETDPRFERLNRFARQIGG